MRFRTIIPAALIALPIAALFGLVSTFLANVVFVVGFAVAWAWLDSRPWPSVPGASHEIVFFDD